MSHAFIRELRGVTRTAVGAWSNERNADAHIVKGTGDGFLILLAPPDDLPDADLSASRSVAIASMLRRDLPGMCDRWNEFKNTPVDALDVGTVSGVVHGTVRYGRVATPAVDRHDALGEPVVKAFRFAQLRAVGGSDSQNDLVILCTITKEHVEHLLDGEPADEHRARLAQRLRRLTFTNVSPDELPNLMATKGVDDASLWVHVWANQPVLAN